MEKRTLLAPIPNPSRIRVVTVKPGRRKRERTAADQEVMPSEKHVKAHPHSTMAPKKTKD
jgi:hypothetical protein